MKKHILHMTNPADCWENASPVGNGSMGAMFFGDPQHERIYLSEETIWSGKKRNTTDPGFRDKIDVIRKMHLEGRDAEIDDWAKENLSDSISKVRSVEYAGVITIDDAKNGEYDNYTRDIDLNAGVLSIGYEKNLNTWRREAFSAYADEITAIKTDTSRRASFYIGFERENTDSLTFNDNILLATAHTVYGDHHFAVGIKIITDGELSFDNGRVLVSEQSSTVLFVSITTEFNFKEAYEDVCLDILSEAEDYKALKKSHVADFTSLSERSDISLDYPARLDKLPVAERLKRLKDDPEAEDMGLVELYFAFGKYLMISSSRDGTQPANLQGVWVEKLENPWNADYHTNINIQMNYWLCEAANLPDCHIALFDWMNTILLPSGRKTAEVNYKCRGTVTHHLSDLYGFSTPADGLWGIWPMGGAWLAYHMWEHYLYTLDSDFLVETAYEYIRDAALFFIDYLFEDKDGYLVTGPSMSPENLYYLDTPEGKQESYLAFSPAMDTEIIAGLLEFYIETENILGISPENKAQAERVLAKLPPLTVGKHGQLMEWREDFDEPEPGHRHISHAFALYPGKSITRETPELYAAIRKTLERRLSHGGGHTGWSRAWLISLFARLHEGDSVYENIRALLTKSTADNLFDTHPPFQIDGNFGGAAGIAEALIQSHEGFISVLPAVNERFSGSFSGLKARGNVEVSAKFTKGKLTSLTLSSPDTKTVLLETKENAEDLERNEKGLYEINISEKPTVIRFN